MSDRGVNKILRNLTISGKCVLTSTLLFFVESPISRRLHVQIPNQNVCLFRHESASRSFKEGRGLSPNIAKNICEILLTSLVSEERDRDDTARHYLDIPAT